MHCLLTNPDWRIWYSKKCICHLFWTLWKPCCSLLSVERPFYVPDSDEFSLLTSSFCFRFLDDILIFFSSTYCDSTGRKARWVGLLREFPVKILYRPRQPNIIADAFSHQQNFEVSLSVLLDFSKESPPVTLSSITSKDSMSSSPTPTPTLSSRMISLKLSFSSFTGTPLSLSQIPVLLASNPYSWTWFTNIMILLCPYTLDPKRIILNFGPSSSGLI